MGQRANALADRIEQGASALTAFAKGLSDAEWRTPVPRDGIALHGRDSVLATALGRDFKGKVSVVIYLVAIPLAFVSSWLAVALYVLVAVMWLVPDRRIEKTLAK